MPLLIRRKCIALAFVFWLPFSGYCLAQEVASRNVSVLGVVQRTAESAVNHENRTVFLALEEDPLRSNVYVAPSVAGPGFDQYTIRESGDIELLESIVLDNVPESSEVRDIKFFKHLGIEYVAVSLSHTDVSTGRLDVVVYDVSNSDAQYVSGVRSIDDRGFIHLFVYKHSDGRTLLFGAGDGDVRVYDIDAIVNSGDDAFLYAVSSPEQPVESLRGFRDVFVGYEPVTGQDRMYVAGAAGYYVYDVTNHTSDKLVASVNPAGILYGHRVMPDPTGTGLLTAADYRTAPLRFYDLVPVFDGDAPRIRTAIGAWTANWCNYAQEFEFRWPYAFVASMEDGFQMVNFRDPENPYTSAYVNTSSVKSECDPNQGHRGAYDVEVRNRDGLVVVSDLETGIWFLQIEDFHGWDGHGWGIPNVSTVQDWANGPDMIGG